MLDLSPALTEGTNNLLRWRSRYTAMEYPEKVVVNIFYRRYTMMTMWSDLMIKTRTQRIPDFSTAFLGLEHEYSNTATQKVVANLENWLERDPYKIVGAIRYSDFLDPIDRCQSGSKAAKEELEYDYLYFMLSDKAVLGWAAMCITGKTPLDAITAVSDAIIQPMPLDDYNVVVDGLGRLLVARFLMGRYHPLP